MNVPKQCARVWTLSAYQLGKVLSPVWKRKADNQALFGLYKVAAGK